MHDTQASFLQSALRDAFPRETRARGRDYFDRRRVYGVEFQAQAVSGQVIGSQEYAASIDWTGAGDTDGVEFWCECPAFEKFGPCKHLWALVLAAEIRAPANFADRVPDAAPTPSRHERQVWRNRVGSLLHRLTLERRDPWQGLAESAVQILYVIAEAASIKSGLMVLRTHFRKRTKSGRWGAPRPYVAAQPGGMSLLDARDRRILSKLGGTESSGWARSNPLPADCSNFALDAEYCQELLPTICATGRLCTADRKRGELRPLAWDDGPAWRPRVDFEEDAATGGGRLVGTLVREGQTLELSAPVLVLPIGFLIVDQRLSRFDARGSMAILADLRANGPLIVDAGDRAECLETLFRLAQPVLADLPGRPDAVVEAPTPSLFIRGDGTRSHGARSLDCLIHFDYGGVEVQPADPRDVVFDASQKRLIQRDLAAESRYLAAFLAAGGLRQVDDEWHGRQAFVKAGQLPRLVRTLLEQGWHVNAQGKIWTRAGRQSIAVRSGVDWFELEGGMLFGDQVASLPALLAAAKRGDHVVQLGDGSVGLLPESWLAGWGLLEMAGQVHGDSVRFPRLQGFLLDALLAEKEGVTTDDGFEQMRESLRGFEGIEPRNEPPSFQGSLRGYQRDGLGWFAFLRQMGFGGCLADDMGLGKTVQVLALLEERRIAALQDGGVKPRPSLVVAPRSLIFNWIDEAARFTPQLKIVDYTGSGRRQRYAEWDDADLVITTYGTVRRDILDLKSMPFDYVVLDEATAIKNSASQAAKASRLLSARHRLALSGTPIENHLGELWSLFEFLNPGMLGRSRRFQAFLAEGAKDAGAAAETAEFSRLASAVRPFFLRRTKQAVLQDLPPKTEQTIHCEFSPDERREYDELRDHYRAALLGRGPDEAPDLSTRKFQVLEALLRLRQASCHPGLIDPARAGEESSKLETLLPMLHEIVAEGHKALVFSQFTSLLAIVRRRLDADGIRYTYLDGRTRQRKDRVEEFQNDPACPLFLISLKAGGHGLNLTAADYIFLLDPWWNPAVESQAIDRAHRIGRTRPVSAYRIIVRDTVEEKVIELQSSKRHLADAILQEGRGLIQDLTRDDLERLLS